MRCNARRRMISKELILVNHRWIKKKVMKQSEIDNLFLGICYARFDDAMSSIHKYIDILFIYTHTYLVISIHISLLYA